MDAIAILILIVLHQIPRPNVQRFRRLAALSNVLTRDIDTDTTIAWLPVVAVVVDLQHRIDRCYFRRLAVDVEFAIGIRFLLSHQVVEAGI